MEVILSTNNVFVKKSEVLMDSCSTHTDSQATDRAAKEMLADKTCGLTVGFVFVWWFFALKGQ